ncbi:Cyclin-T1 [Frankliniella fusca]|uniref:Cyclin-T1 n=1 Tax=Frankliniella fusca TaxID=407009 RepID=A0AAE1H9T2_9NEOP|nr:Cyclin-T1 [Frankliniella fusca]
MVAEVLLVVGLLCPCGVRAAIAVGDMMSPANEAAAATALLSAILPAHKACLLVLGRAPWSGDLLRALPGETQRAMLDKYASYDEDVRLDTEVRLTHHVLLVLADAPEDFKKLSTMPNLHRALLWARVSRSPHEVVQNKTLLHHISQTRRVSDMTALALTDADGDVHLFSDRLLVTGERPFIAVDRWSAQKQRWLQGTPPFLSFCVKWTQPRTNEPLNLITVAPPNLFRHADEIVRYGSTQRKISNYQFEVSARSRHKLIAGLTLARSMTEKCKLDGLLGMFGMPPSNPLEEEYLFRDDWSYIVVVVPAGQGAVVNPLSAVLLEFSPAMWYGTALAALGTAAALACTLRRDRGAALLLALAPLLAQPPPPPPAASPALRPLLTVWLLVCLVLVAAYQGLLLGMLSSARPRGEIDSLEALEVSGLPVFASFEAFHAIRDTLPGSLRSRIDIRNAFDHTFRELVHERIVHARNAAAITFLDSLPKQRLETWALHEKKIHEFQIGSGFPRVLAVWQRGSDLGNIITKVMRRIWQAGLKLHSQRLDKHGELLEIRKGSWARPRPLTLSTMLPAFLFLAGGLTLAAFVFVFVEFLPVFIVHRGVVFPRQS